MRWTTGKILWLVRNLWVEPSLCKWLTRIDRDWLWIFILVSFHVLYIFSVNLNRNVLIQISHNSFICPALRMSGYRDTDSWFGDYISFPGSIFWVNLGQKMTKFKSFKCSYLLYNFPSSSVKILRFYFHFWLELDRVSSTYIRMDPSSGLILA